MRNGDKINDDEDYLEIIVKYLKHRILDVRVCSSVELYSTLSRDNMYDYDLVSEGYIN